MLKFPIAIFCMNFVKILFSTLFDKYYKFFTNLRYHMLHFQLMYISLIPRSFSLFIPCNVRDLY